MAFKKKSSPTAGDDGTRALTKNGPLIRQNRYYVSGDDRSEPKCWHIKYVYGLTHDNGATPNYRNRDLIRFGQSISINNGYIAIGAPGDIHIPTSDTNARQGAVYTYDYDGNYIRRYANRTPSPDSRLGEVVAITNSGDLITNDWRGGGSLLKTQLWNYPDTFIHEQLDMGVYQDTLDTVAQNTFRHIGTPRRFANYNFIQGNAAQLAGAGFEFQYEMLKHGSYISNPGAILQNFLHSTNQRVSSSNTYISPEINYGFSVAAGCNRFIVSAYGGTSYPSIEKWYATLFDDNGIKLRDIDCPDSDERWGYWKNSMAIGCGRIVIASGNGGKERVYVFDLNGNYLFKIDPEDDVYSGGKYWGQSVAVGCGRIVVSSTPVSSLEQNGTNERIYIYDLNGNLINSVGRHDAHGDDFQSNGFQMDTTATVSGFGYSIDIGSGMIVVGAPYYDYSTYQSLGACFVLDLDGNPLVSWTLYGLAIANGTNNQEAASTLGDDSFHQTYAGGNTLITPGHRDFTNYGRTVAVNDGVIAVGAPQWERGTGYPDAHGLVTISHFDHLGLDQNIEQAIRADRTNYLMRTAENSELPEVREILG